MSDDDLIRRVDALACLGQVSVAIDRAAIEALPAVSWRIRLMKPVDLARLFHANYEALAPWHGYETREETREFDPTTHNGQLMVATCARILAALDVEYK